MITNKYFYNKNDIVTVFFQGNCSSRSQAANYAGDDGLDIKISENNFEHIYVPNAPLILHNIFATNDLSDVGYGYSLNPLHMCLKLKSLIVNYYCNIQTANYPHTYVTVLKNICKCMHLHIFSNVLLRKIFYAAHRKAS